MLITDVLSVVRMHTLCYFRNNDLWPIYNNPKTHLINSVCYLETNWWAWWSIILYVNDEGVLSIGSMMSTVWVKKYNSRLRKSVDEFTKNHERTQPRQAKVSWWVDLSGSRTFRDDFHVCEMWFANFVSVLTPLLIKVRSKRDKPTYSDEPDTLMISGTPDVDTHDRIDLQLHLYRSFLHQHVSHESNREEMVGPRSVIFGRHNYARWQKNF